MTQALRSFIAALPTPTTLLGETFADNVASQRILEKLGFIKTGTYNNIIAYNEQLIVQPEIMQGAGLPDVDTQQRRMMFETDLYQPFQAAIVYKEQIIGSIITYARVSETGDFIPNETILLNNYTLSGAIAGWLLALAWLQLAAQFYGKSAPRAYRMNGFSNSWF
ncbi:GNAT family N-acetyltransferase [Weissella confusa]|uniref:GNAT family N-acetyltransferase n=1 Tax=Weissella confusa TaxID=1583 RepID=A0A923NKH8_WEICO|nr:GNAT family N-acetyltransferase [Weissella confusa]